MMAVQAESIRFITREYQNQPRIVNTLSHLRRVLLFADREGTQVGIVHEPLCQICTYLYRTLEDYRDIDR